jgi:hypothetical protein
MSKRAPPWREDHDAEFRRLVGAGYSVARLHVHFKKPTVFIKLRAKALGLTIKPPPRLPTDQRIGAPPPFNRATRS